MVPMDTEGASEMSGMMEMAGGDENEKSSSGHDVMFASAPKIIKEQPSDDGQLIGS